MRDKWINRLIALIIVIGVIIAFQAEPYKAEPVTCPERLRISELKYKAVAAEVLSLKKTIEQLRVERIRKVTP